MFKKSMFKTFAVVLALSCFSLVISGCGKKIDSLTEIKNHGEIILGTSADLPPYEFHRVTKNNGDEIVGLDISIAKEIAKDIGVKLEIKNMKFDGLLASLALGNVDFVMAGLSITDERKKSVDFSNKYFSSDNKVLIRKEDNKSIVSINDLKGKIVGAQKGSIQAAIVKNQLTNSELKEIGKISDLILELATKKVDAIILEDVAAKIYASKNTNIVTSSIEINNGIYGAAIAVKKGDSSLLNAINKTLERLNKANLINKYHSEAVDASYTSLTTTIGDVIDDARIGDHNNY